MKIFIYILFCGLALGGYTENIDVVKLLDGTVYKGSIIEKKLNDGTGCLK